MTETVVPYGPKFEQLSIMADLSFASVEYAAELLGKAERYVLYVAREAFEDNVGQSLVTEVLRLRAERAGLRERKFAMEVACDETLRVGEWYLEANRRRIGSRAAI